MKSNLSLFSFVYHALDSLPILGLEDFLQCFPIKILWFYVSHLDLWSIWLNCCVGVKVMELHMWCSGKESVCQCRRCKRVGFNPRVRKTPWSRKWQPTPVFLPGKIPWREEPGRLQSMGSQRVGHDWTTSLLLSHVDKITILISWY